MRLPNGFGSVYRLSGKRHKPWAARVFIGREIKDKSVTRKYKYVGYYRTKKEAIEALALYNENPYETTAGALTFAQVFEKWKDNLLEKSSPNTLRSWDSAYYCCERLYNLPFASLKVDILEDVIKTAKNKKGEDASLHMKGRIKSLYNHLYRYALKHEIATKDYAALVDSVGKAEPKIIRIPFSESERAIVFDNLDFPYMNMIAVALYSGWRPGELAQLRTDKINLDAGTMQGGIKTASGINRIVPIHSKIIPIIQDIYDPEKEFLFYREDGAPMDYEAYRKRWNKIMKRFNMNHKPHDTRHTFITLAKECELNEYLLKRIVGHEVNDITEKVYTHRTIESLKAEIEKITI
ncbi:MAG: tyrosine-type recombinase/integrase [Eubacterium aggregans]|uniref:Phage integrase family protein n=1 Tax=Eubacterium aggregans TaxID=81409 RepID=A0A1H3YUU7_9FIRM|nr:tyrosine-type recombinase/integrase [Eubacterium aggregans]MEA5074416.1 tyrosine-type recombinase/integrase [Eubacterium aggregans]SEA14804.1 Phage integrase family protein [Eubacterium aggregans]